MDVATAGLGMERFSSGYYFPERIRLRMRVHISHISCEWILELQSSVIKMSFHLDSYDESSMFDIPQSRSLG